MMHGDFVWYDIMTTDTAAATAFYERVIGWTSADAGMPGQPYTLLSAGPAVVGGLMAIPEAARAAGAKPTWMGYVGVDDVDAYADEVTKTGGAVHRAPDDIPGVGRFAVVADPHGASFMLFKGIGEAPPPAAPGTPGHVGWHELHAGDGAPAFDWYAGLFGWTKDRAIDMGAMGVYQTFTTGQGQAGGGMMTKMAHQPMPFWLYYFNVEAIDARRRARREGRARCAARRGARRRGRQRRGVDRRRCRAHPPPQRGGGGPPKAVEGAAASRLSII